MKIKITILLCFFFIFADILFHSAISFFHIYATVRLLYPLCMVVLNPLSLRCLRDSSWPNNLQYSDVDVPQDNLYCIKYIEIVSMM
jgi:hypothetical protein